MLCLLLFAAILLKCSQLACSLHRLDALASGVICGFRGCFDRMRIFSQLSPMMQQRAVTLADS